MQRYFISGLNPGEDLKKSIQSSVDANLIEAGWIASCVGSLTEHNVRFANVREGSQALGHFKIVSLTGTLSISGSHLHISVSDSEGKTTGGHWLDQCIVDTTVEIIIQSAHHLRFTRENDGAIQWKELRVEEK